MAFQMEETVENKLKPIKSSPVLPGTIQLTPQGKLIILMRDGKLLVVILEFFNSQRNP